MFQFIFALLGFFTGGLFGAFIGWSVGSMLDRYLAYGAGGVNPFTVQQRRQIFAKTLFQLAGCVAKVGRAYFYGRN